MTQQQAAERAERIVRETAAALDPVPHLDFDPAGNFTSPCLADLPFAEVMVQVNRTAWLRGVPAGQQVDVANQIKSDWEKRGYEITSTANFGQGRPAVYAFNPDDDRFAVFSFSVETNAEGDMFVSAESPCVWPGGAPLSC